ncbi:hypothetical protein AX16_003559 [Volvariella volvacea WC 439]|nr:hypothetical protein AX16_003559 [Volvariella volvacea WC 439]
MEPSAPAMSGTSSTIVGRMGEQYLGPPSSSAPQQNESARPYISTSISPQALNRPDSAANPTTEPYNVLIFGQTGVGKSSLVNMLAGQNIARTSNGAMGCTFGSTPCDISLSINGRSIRLWDTAGLNEAAHGTVSAEEAVENLKTLVAELNGRIDLLVYCITGGRLREIVMVNYDLFFRVFCQKKVPIMLVVTGLELEEDMEKWWDDNRGELEDRGMKFVTHACITTTKGKEVRGEYQFEDEYDESQVLVRGVLLHALATFPAIGAVDYKAVWKNALDTIYSWLAPVLKATDDVSRGSKARRPSQVPGYAVRARMAIRRAWVSYWDKKQTNDKAVRTK